MDESFENEEDYDMDKDWVPYISLIQVRIRTHEK